MKLFRKAFKRPSKNAGTTLAVKRFLGVERLESRRLLAGIKPSDRSDFDQAFGTEFVRLGDSILFQGSDERFGHELWRYDPARTTARMVADLSPGAADTAISDLTTAGSKAFFIGGRARTDGVDYSLWATDGTEDGTLRVAEDIAATFSRGISEFNDSVVFSIVEADPRQPWRRSYELWASDGTIAGTRRFFAADELEQFPRGHNGRYGVGTKDAFHFVTEDGKYYTTDGTQEGTRFIGMIEFDYAAELASVEEFPNGTVLQFAGRGANPDFRFVSDSGILPLEAVFVDKDLSFSTTLRLGNEIFFQPWNSITERVELWAADGSLGSLRQIQLPEEANAGLTRYSEMVVVNDLLVTILSRQTSSINGVEVTESFYGTFDPTDRTWRTSSDPINVTRESVVQGSQLITRVIDSLGFTRFYSFDLESMSYREIDLGVTFDVDAPKIIGNDAFFAAHTAPGIGSTQRDSVVLRRDSNGDISTVATYRLDLFGRLEVHAVDEIGVLVASVNTSDHSFLSAFDRESHFQRKDIASSSRQYSGFFYRDFTFAGFPDSNRISTTEFIVSAGGESLSVSDGTALGTQTVFSPAWLLDSQSSTGRFRLGTTYHSNGNVFFTTLRRYGRGADHRIWSLDDQRRPVLLLQSEFSRGYVFQILGAINGRLVFATQAFDDGRQSLWSSSVAGDHFQLLADDLPSINSIRRLPRIESDSELYFYVGDQALSAEQVLAECRPGQSCPPSGLDFGELAVWRTDGTKEGTVVASQAPTSVSRAIEFRDAYGGTLLGSVDGKAILLQSDISEQTVDPVRVFGPLGIERTLRFPERLPLSRPVVTSRGMFVLLDREEQHGVWRVNVDEESLTPVQHLQFDKSELPRPTLGVSGDPNILVLFDQTKRFKLLSDGVTNFGEAPLAATNRHPVGIDAERLIDSRRLQYAEDQFVDERFAELWTLSSENGQMQIESDGVVLYSTPAAETFVDLSSSVGPVVLNVDSLRIGKTKRLLLKPPSGSEVTLTGSNVGDVRYNEFEGRLLIQFAGFEVLLDGGSGIRLVDRVTASGRSFRGSPDNDDIQLGSEANQPAIKVSSNDLDWSVTLASSGAVDDISFETSSGSTSVLIRDDFFESLSEGTHSVSFSSPTNGIDTISIEVPDSFNVRRLNSGVGYSKSDSATTLRIEIGLPNRPLQNPRQRHDVNLDGAVTPRDALAVLNQLMHLHAGHEDNRSEYFYDVTGDQLVTPLDALVLINHLGTTYTHRLSSESETSITLRSALTVGDDEEDLHWDDRDGTTHLW